MKGSYIANAFVSAFKEALLEKEHDLDTDIIKATLIDTADETYSATDTTYVAGANGIVDASKVAVSSALASPRSRSASSMRRLQLDHGHRRSVRGDHPVERHPDYAHGRPADPVDGYGHHRDVAIITPNGGNINVTVNAAGWFAL